MNGKRYPESVPTTKMGSLVTLELGLYNSFFNDSYFLNKTLLKEGVIWPTTLMNAILSTGYRTDPNMDFISPINTPKTASREVTDSQQSRMMQRSAEFTLSKPNFKGDIDRGTLPPEEARQLTREYSQRADNAWGKIVETTYDLRSVYAGVQSALLSRNPSLLEKDWDFTIDSKGELLIVEGEDPLTKREIEFITDILEKHGVDDYMKNLSESIVERGVASRDPEMRMHEHGIGSYDVSMDNMSDILRGRELMNDTKIRPVNRGPSSVWMPIEAYNKDKLDPLQAVMKQLSSRANNVYEYSRVKTT